ncbi:hypothetical protein LSAT2_021919, partial [Lamellibrachia satsuma]
MFITWRLVCIVLVTLVARSENIVAGDRDLVFLLGSGASFPDRLYMEWGAAFKAFRNEQDVKLKTTYESIGSGAGNEVFIDRTQKTHYAGSDLLLTDKKYEQDTDLQMFPTCAGAVAIIVNLPGIKSLNLTRELLVGIYNGTYTSWSDPDLKRVNPRVDLPKEHIRVVVRSDTSGTTEIFTRALSAFDARWRETFGWFSHSLNESGVSSRSWNSSGRWLSGRTSLGVSGIVTAVKYSISYVSLLAIHQLGITRSNITNKAGKLVAPSPVTVLKVVQAGNGTFDKRFNSDLVDGKEAQSYPIVAYTYLVIRMNTMKSCRSATELYRYIKWMTTSDEAKYICRENGMIPLGKAASERVASDVLTKFTCNGKAVAELVEQEESKKRDATSQWKTITTTVIPFAITVVFVLVIYIAREHLRVNRALYRREWKIPYEEIELVSVETLRKSNLFKSNSVFTQSGDKGSRWAAGRVKVGIYQ